MKQINIDIIDDADTNIAKISKVIEMHYPVLKINKIINKKAVSIKDVLFNKPHVVFISLNKYQNNELLNNLIYENIFIIVIISSNQQALTAFKYNAIYCLKTPLEFSDIYEAINKIFVKMLMSK